MFVYLASNSGGGRIVLPEAVSVEADSTDSAEVRFLAANGSVVAIFRRADVSVHSATDLGMALVEGYTDTDIEGPGRSFGL